MEKKSRTEQESGSRAGAIIYIVVGLISIWRPLRGDAAQSFSGWLRSVTVIGEPSVIWVLAEALYLLSDPDTIWLDEPERAAA